MAGNFSGGSFSGAVGGFSVDGGPTPTVTPRRGGSTERYEQNMRWPLVSDKRKRKKHDDETDEPQLPQTVEETVEEIRELKLEQIEVKRMVAEATTRARADSLKLHDAMVSRRIAELEEYREVVQLVADLEDEF